MQELSSFGWSEVRRPYRRGTDDGLDFRGAFGIERKMTPCASATVSRLAVQLGSFKEARDTLALLGCSRMSASKVRDETHSRQLRVMNFFEYCSVDGKGTPVPIRGSFSYAVTDGEIAETTGLLKVQGVARGSGTAPRMQCVADGEEALEKALRDAFPFAEFTNDVMHACGYLSACCRALGVASPAKEYATCRRIMFRHGGMTMNGHFFNELKSHPGRQSCRRFS